ncbi:MAG: C45 family peptidase [Bacteroidales bacterium]|nr:C45 family peptidase [Bacteroidales bacterium]
MKRVLIRIAKYLLLIFTGFVTLTVITGVILYKTAERSLPQLDLPGITPELAEMDGYTSFGSSTLRRGQGDLWELHLRGNPSVRGLALGELCREMMYRQESAFINEIRRMIPSERYLSFLKYITIIFNRNLSANIPLEYKQEIYAASFACSSEFDFIGSAYERQLNYHAAHDLGHAMQEYMLVGCSSFGVWGAKSADSSLLIGRNFDFYVGDEFAKEKVVSFIYPDKGYRFASVSWAGMVGVLSGMNEKGVTVTLNAAKSQPPIASKTPISIIAREILQYASTIDEAFEIAAGMEAFVSESILIGSAKDGVAAIIEKSPGGTNLFRVDGDMIISTNHFQSKEFLNNTKNRKSIESIEGSHSLYRYKRLDQLIAESSPVTLAGAAATLRDYRGLGNKEIGLTNEMSINQFIAHHAVIFQPESLMMWVSSSDWQLGKMVAYDLGALFSVQESGEKSPLTPLREELAIEADSAAIAGTVPIVREFREGAITIRDAVKEKRVIERAFTDRFLIVNSQYYYTYELLGDYYLAIGERELAAKHYGIALECDIPYPATREMIAKKLKSIKR